MKFLDKVGLVAFATLILLEGLALILAISGWLELELIVQAVENIITGELASRITLVVSIVLILLAIKCIFLNSDSKSTSSGKEGILLENDNGKLLVSRDTIESLANTVIKSFDSAETVMTKVEVDEESHIKIYITLSVHPDAVIKDLSAKLQSNVKDAIKKSLDLDVTEVNIRVKNISVKKEPQIKE